MLLLLSATGDSKGAVLDANQIAEVGQLLVEWLVDVKHNGAFEKVHEGFRALCER